MSGSNLQVDGSKVPVVKVCAACLCRLALIRTPRPKFCGNPGLYMRMRVWSGEQPQRQARGQAGPEPPALCVGQMRSPVGLRQSPQSLHLFKGREVRRAEAYPAGKGTP